MIPCCQYSLLYHETFYDFNFFDCARIQLSALAFGCWTQSFLKGRRCALVSVSPSLQPQFPFKKKFLQHFCQTLTSYYKKWVRLPVVINSSPPMAPLLKTRKQSQFSAVIGRGWVCVGITVDLVLSSPTPIPCSLFAFVRVVEGNISSWNFEFHSWKLLQQGWAASCSRICGSFKLMLIIAEI